MLFKFEFKKLMFQPVIVGFIVLSILLNTYITISTYYDYKSEHESDMVNIFEGFKASDIAKEYIGKNITGKNAENIQNKYEKLQSVIDEKAASKDALSYYFGETTYYHHHNLFKTMFMAIVAECCLLAMFITLISVTYENLNGTELLINTTKVGRNVLKTKLYASLTAAILTTVIIIGFSLLIYFLRFDFSKVWSSNVSSMFNFAANEYGWKPFITWQSFTVKEYLWAVIGLTFGMAICFCLLGFISGVFIRKGYFAFIFAMIIVIIPFLIKEFFAVGSVIRGIVGITPTWLWINSGEWFTDGGADIIWPYFESLGVLSSFIVLIILMIISMKMYKKRELL